MPITDRDFHWPTRSDYDLAMYNMQESVLDTDIRDGILASSNSRIHHFGGAITTSLYRVEDLQGRNWAIRCFCEADAALEEGLERTSPPPDILSRYKKIEAFCNAHKGDIPALSPITYVKQGIEVNYFERDFADRPVSHLKKEILPFIKMPFIRGISLGRFIASKCSQYSDLHDKDALRLLADAWVEMIRSLEKAHMAHGDLDLTNVKVEAWQLGSLPVLRLIDYDNFYIPELAGYPQTEKGHEAFQHPYFFWAVERPFNEEMDRFSALVIYISIKVLAAYPEMYQKAGADESNRLLFTSRDYQREQESSSSRIQELIDLNVPGLTPFLEALRYSLQNNCMPPSLDEIGGGDVELTPRRAVAPLSIEDPDPVVPNRGGREEEYKPAEILEISWIDWENADYRVARDEPLIKDSPTPASQAPRNWPPRPSTPPPPERNRRSPDPERPVRAAQPEPSPQPPQRQEPSRKEQEWEYPPVRQPRRAERQSPQPQRFESQPPQARQPQYAEQPQPSQARQPQYPEQPQSSVRQPQRAEQQLSQLPQVRSPQRMEPQPPLAQPSRPQAQRNQQQGSRESDQEAAWNASPAGAASYDDFRSPEDLTTVMASGRDYGYNANGYEDDSREHEQVAWRFNPTLVGCIAVVVVVLLIVLLVFLIVHATALAPQAPVFAQVPHLLLIPHSALHFHKIV